MNTTKLSLTLAGLTAIGLLSACNGGDPDVQPAPPTGRPPASEFAFDTTPADSPLYTRVDRTGAPAVGTALLSRGNITVTRPDGSIVNPGIPTNTFNDQRDQLNRGDPVNDAADFAGVFVAGPQDNSLKNIHFKLNAELRALGLTPCSTLPAGGAATKDDVNVDACVAQAAPAILPDVITYDFAAPEGFPNGRTFDDPVVDRLLAAALLKLTATGGPHSINTLVGVIDPWNGPTGQGCAAPCRFTGDETGTPVPTTFPFLRPVLP
jgi:hypothetical protein